MVSQMNLLEFFEQWAHIGTTIAWGKNIKMKGWLSMFMKIMKKLSFSRKFLDYKHVFLLKNYFSSTVICVILILLLDLYVVKVVRIDNVLIVWKDM